MRIWKLTLGLTLGALALILATLAMMPSAANAQSATPTPPATSSAPLKPGPRGQFGLGRHNGKSLISATASVTGLTEQEVATELQSGKSLAQIAESKGKTADEVVAAARTQLQDALTQAVTAGRLTQAQADVTLADFDQTASQIVSDTTLGQRLGSGRGPGRGGFGGGRHNGKSLISATASVTGLTEQEVATELQSGKSLAQIAESKGKTADEVIAAARTQLQDALTQAVTAGRLTQAQVDAKLQQFDQTAAQVVSDTTLGQRLGRCFNKQLAPTTPTNTGSDA